MSKNSVALKVPPEFWALSALPEGYIERWLVTDGTRVKAGSAVALVRVEGSLHELIAPATGKLTIESAANSVVDPGMPIGQIAPQLDA
jgi:hypothetical protein